MATRLDERERRQVARHFLMTAPLCVNVYVTQRFAPETTTPAAVMPVPHCLATSCFL